MPFWVQGRDSQTGHPTEFFSEAASEEDACAEAFAQGIDVDRIEEHIETDPSDAQDEPQELDLNAEEVTRRCQEVLRPHGFWLLGGDWERFTGRCHKVLQFANAEADRLKRHTIGTEHILLGLVAANVLKGLDLDEMRLRVEAIVRPRPDRAPSDPLPQTPRVAKVIEHSVAEARDLQSWHVDTEHLLLGLLSEKEGVAAQVFMNLGLSLENARTKVLFECLQRLTDRHSRLKSAEGAITNVAPAGEAIAVKNLGSSIDARNSILKDPSSRPVPNEVLFTAQARKVWELAIGEARRLHRDHLGTEHILAGLMLEGTGIAAEVLKSLGLDLGAVQQEMESLTPSVPNQGIQVGRPNSGILKEWQGNGPSVPSQESEACRPLTPRAEMVIRIAIEEARRLQQARVDTEHVLVALLREEQGVAAEILKDLDLDLGTVLSHMQKERLQCLNDPSALEMWRDRSVTKRSAEAVCRERSLETREQAVQPEPALVQQAEQEEIFNIPAGLVERPMPARQQSHLALLVRIGRGLSRCGFHCFVWGWIVEVAIYLTLVKWIGEGTYWAGYLTACHIAFIVLLCGGLVPIAGIIFFLSYGVRCSQCASLLSRQKIVAHSTQLYKCRRCHILWNSGIQDESPRR